MIKYSIIEIIRDITKKEGFLALYKGLSACCLGLIHPIIYFPLYENLKWRCKKYKGKIKSTDIFVISCISKITSAFLTYPHVLLRSQYFCCYSLLKNYFLIRMQNNREKMGNNNLFDLIRKIHKEEGLRGFYFGMKIDLIRVLPSNAITFIVYEYVKKLLLKKKSKSH